VVLGCDGTAARLRLDDGSEVALPLGEIRRARLVLTDALIEASAHMAQPAGGNDPAADGQNDMDTDGDGAQAPGPSGRKVH
jgi:ribosome maturation factor RimP